MINLLNNIIMGIDAILLEIIFDWTFINPLIERDDGIMDEEPTQLSEQTLAQQQIAPEVYY